MKAYMPTVGTRGLDMMFRTCTIQVNLDFESEQDMIDKFRIGLALQPISVALFANSPFTEGKPTGYLSARGKSSRNCVSHSSSTLVGTASCPIRHMSTYWRIALAQGGSSDMSVCIFGSICGALLGTAEVHAHMSSNVSLTQRGASFEQKGLATVMLYYLRVVGSSLSQAISKAKCQTIMNRLLLPVVVEQLLAVKLLQQHDVVTILGLLHVGPAQRMLCLLHAVLQVMFGGM